MKEVILGVTGSIAAYKAADLSHMLVKDGFGVTVIMTESAQEFVTPLTFQTLTKNKVYLNMFEKISHVEVEHVSLAQKADICIIAPATANIIGRLASGIADDMLTTVIMAMQNKPVVICPAMNTAMYENKIVQDNIEKLMKHGYQFIEPREARLACGDVGKGAMEENDSIIRKIKEILKESEK